MIKRKKTIEVKVGNLVVGGNNPIAVQSMTNTDTSNIDASYAQVCELIEAGSELVRLTVDTKEAALAIPKIKDKLISANIFVPIIGDFHYNGHVLLNEVSDCAEALDKYRINPGNVGQGEKRDIRFSQIIEIALKYNKPVRIGVNWGSLDQNLLKTYMDENLASKNPKSNEEVMREVIVASALNSAKYAEKLGMGADKIIISAKVSKVMELVEVYRELSRLCDYPLHLGLTEAGMGSEGVVASSAALAILLEEGIGDTIRVSITPRPNEARSSEVKIAKEILQSLELRHFKPRVSACPGCGRTSSSYFQELTEDIQGYLASRELEWRQKYPDYVKLKIAVMGCIVNGPGESEHADIGISLPGNGENPAAPVFADGKKITTLRGENILDSFKVIVDDYVKNRWGS